MPRKGTPSSRPRWLRPVGLFILDVVLIGIGLLIFAYFHHVRPVSYSTDDLIVISRPGQTETPAPTESPVPGDSPTAEPDPTATPTPAPTATPDPNDWGVKFADQFTSGEVEITDTGYRSENISISITRHTMVEDDGDPQVWYVADIYLRSIDSLKTAFAHDTYGRSYTDWPALIANNNGAILAITGDYYGAREKGVVIRNGVVYRTALYKDICILYYDGSMETMAARDFNLDNAVSRGAYHAFSFGPALLDENGKAKEYFDTEIAKANPRCAIGYYEPGHYCFIVADGRNDHSRGLYLTQLAQIFEDLGCASAYNLDGGGTASMIFRNKIINTPHEGGRKVSDIIYIGEVAE